MRLLSCGAADGGPQTKWLRLVVLIPVPLQWNHASHSRTPASGTPGHRGPRRRTRFSSHEVVLRLRVHDVTCRCRCPEGCSHSRRRCARRSTCSEALRRVIIGSCRTRRRLPRSSCFWQEPFARPDEAISNGQSSTKGEHAEGGMSPPWRQGICVRRERIRGASTLSERQPQLDGPGQGQCRDPERDRLGRPTAPGAARYMMGLRRETVLSPPCAPASA